MNIPTTLISGIAWALVSCCTLSTAPVQCTGIYIQVGSHVITPLVFVQGTSQVAPLIAPLESYTATSALLYYVVWWESIPERPRGLTHPSEVKLVTTGVNAFSCGVYSP